MKEKQYNLAKVKALSEDDPEFIKAIVQAFIDEIPRDMELLTTAVTNGDRNSVHDYAHKMKPSIDMFGLPCLGDILMLEAWGKSNDPMDIRENLIRASMIVDKVIDQLKEDF